MDGIFADAIVSHTCGSPTEGRKIYSAWDAYQQSNLVTYRSAYEGFGSAFFEAIYSETPILCNRYAIYRTDIEPCGFKVCLMEGYLRDEVVEEVRRVLADEEYRR